MTLSPHIIVDNCPDDLLERAFLYLKRVKQLKFVNIGAGAQIDRGMNFVARVHREIPHLRIVWRNLDIEDDTGILQKWGAQKVYDLRVKKYLKWFQENKVIFMPDNESSGDDAIMRKYADDEAQIGKWLHENGLNGAFCRFATGNIADGNDPNNPVNQYPLLKPIFDMMNAGDLVSPNEYRNRPGGSSAGHLFRYRNLWNAAGRPLPTFIGEAGVSVNYDPGIGYQAIGLSDEDYCKLMLGDEIWYEDGNIDRSVYLVGGYTHETFRWRLGIFDYLENYYDKAPPVIVTPPDPVLPAFPSDFDARAQTGIAIAGTAVNVRSQPSLSAMLVGTLLPDMIARYIPVDKLKPAEKIVSTINGVTAVWLPVALSTPANGRGWVWGGLVTWRAIPPFNLQVLTVLYNDLIKASNRTRQMSLELAAISDDLLKNSELLDVMIKANESTNK